MTACYFVKLVSVKTSEAGNVLFLILIAVALFAALSYVVTQSSRSGSGDTSTEQAKLLMAQIDSLSAALSTAMLHKQVRDSCTLTDLTDNICPPNPGGCAWIQKPQCNVLAEGAFSRPSVNWDFNNWLVVKLQARGGAPVSVELWFDDGGAWLSGYHILYAGFTFRDGSSPISSLLEVCKKRNTNGGFPSPAEVFLEPGWAEMMSKNDMSSPFCAYNAGDKEIYFYSPLLKTE